MMRRISWLWLIVFLIGCQQTAEIPPTATLPPTEERPFLPTSTPTATKLPTATAVSTQPPTAVPPTAKPTATVTITPTPHPIAPYTIEGLRSRTFPGGDIQIRGILDENEWFTRSYISYPSDGLNITGIMHTPAGQGPFPVIILLHGYLEREVYWSGANTWQAAEVLIRHGYLTIAPDLRSWGASDVGMSLFHTGLTADVLNLISSLESLPQADTARIGLWGHSMGGGIATKVLLVDERVDTAVLHAPNSADDADLIARWGPGCLPDQSEPEGDHCNPGEVLPPDMPEDLVQAYFAAAADPLMLQQIAPIYHLDKINAPIQIHIGLDDGQTWEETPPEWSMKLAEALENAGKQVTLHTYPGQGHFIYDESWSLMMERTTAFFDETLNP